MTEAKVAFEATFAKINAICGASLCTSASTARGALPLLNEQSSIGEQIKYYRKLYNVTQEELGQAVGMTKYGIGKIENGEIQVFDVKKLQRILEALHIENLVQYHDGYLAFIMSNPAMQLKAYREKEKITMLELSKRLHTEYSVIKNWESGKTIISRKKYEQFLALMN